MLNDFLIFKNLRVIAFVFLLSGTTAQAEEPWVVLSELFFREPEWKLNVLGNKAVTELSQEGENAIIQYIKNFDESAQALLNLSRLAGDRNLRSMQLQLTQSELNKVVARLESNTLQGEEKVASLDKKDRLRKLKDSLQAAVSGYDSSIGVFSSKMEDYNSEMEHGRRSINDSFLALTPAVGEALKQVAQYGFTCDSKDQKLVDNAIQSKRPVKEVFCVNPEGQLMKSATFLGDYDVLSRVFKFQRGQNGAVKRVQVFAIDSANSDKRKETALAAMRLVREVEFREDNSRIEKEWNSQNKVTRECQTFRASLPRALPEGQAQPATSGGGTGPAAK